MIAPNPILPHTYPLLRLDSIETQRLQSRRSPEAVLYQNWQIRDLRMTLEKLRQVDKC